MFWTIVGAILFVMFLPTLLSVGFVLVVSIAREVAEWRNRPKHIKPTTVKAKPEKKKAKPASKFDMVFLAVCLGLLILLLIVK